MFDLLHFEAIGERYSGHPEFIRVNSEAFRGTSEGKSSEESEAVGGFKGGCTFFFNGATVPLFTDDWLDRCVTKPSLYKCRIYLSSHEMIIKPH